MLFEEFRSFFTEEQKKSPLVNLFCSSLGYGIAAAVTNPFDVVKTRRQIQTSNPELFNYSSGIDCARKILRHEGPKAFLDGVTGRVAWLVPRCALAMTGFEYFYKRFASAEPAAAEESF
jgi:hypothetical protein